MTLLNLLWFKILVKTVMLFVSQVEEPLWAPTKISTPSGVKEFPLKDGDYNFLNSAGFQYEAAAIRDCLVKGTYYSEKNFQPLTCCKILKWTTLHY